MIIGFLIGLIIGVAAGVFVMMLLAMAADDKEK